MGASREDFFEQIVEAAPSAIVVSDEQGFVELANAEAARLFGWKREELIGQRIEALVPQRFRGGHPDLRDGYRRSPTQRTMGAGRDLSAVRRDGSEVPVEIGLAPISVDDRQLVLATIVDLTERRRAEQRFRVAVESAPHAVVMIQSDGRIVLVNAEFERLFGYDRSELLQRPIEKVVPERFRRKHPSYRGAFAHAPRTRSMGAGRDLFGRHKDGREIPLEIGLAPIETSEGLFVLATVVDITERSRAEDRFRRAVESAPNAMLMISALGEITLANSRAAAIFGYPSDSLIGRPIEMLVPSRFRGGHAGLRGQFHAKPKARAMGAGRDLFALRQDGSEFPVEIGLNPIDTPEGSFVLASVIDITERKRAEETRALAIMNLEQSNAELASAKGRLEQAVAELSRRNSELDEFSHAVSHDLKSPLRGIDNLASWIIEDAGHILDDTITGWLEEIPRQSARMRRLLDDLLQYTRALHAPGGLEVTDLNSSFERTVQLLDIPAGIAVHAVDTLPIVSLMRVPFEQVLRNVIDNAVKHHDRADGRVEVAMRVEDQRLEVEVRDDGPGIPPELRERAFGLFKSLSRESEGTGLGLALVRRIVEHHGGRVALQDNQPRGTIVDFTWPAIGGAQ